MNVPSVSRSLRMILQAHGVRPGALPRIPAATADVTIDQAREQLRAAAAALGTAFRAGTRKIRVVDSPPVSPVASAVAMLSTLGLGQSSGARPLSSPAPDLGVTSAGAASRLYSAALGLDVTSPETASTLKSSTALGLDVISRASTVVSTGEMNTATTSYGSSTLSFSGSGLPSTSVGTLSGVYTGVGAAAGATSLVVKATANAVLSTLAATNVQFEVRDQADTVLFSYDGNLKAGDTVYLGGDIGLSVAFSAGQLTQDHTGSTTVSHAPVDVDANATFNNADPSLRPQFDGGAQVTAGSFSINGTSITVNADDTINTVLARINASAAGVTAVLAADKITLTTTSSSEADVVLAGDTSGFLSAVKLASATTTRGNIRDDQQVLSQTTQFGSVASGSFTINGVTISVNKDTDTLASLVSQINGAGAGVTASYDSAQDKVLLTTTSKSEDLITVAGDTTGFLAAAGLSTSNTVRGNIRDDQQVLSKTSQFAAVSSGAFTLNGVSISVDEDTDTLASIVTRINGASAGVTAAYDATLGKLVLTATSNSEDLITVAGDTTGFLATASLSTGNTVRGKSRHDRQGSSTTSQLGAATTRTVEIKGKNITVDVERDTLATLVGKINKAEAGVTASFNATTNMLTVSNASAVAATVSSAAEKLNEALSQLGRVLGGSTRRIELETAMRRAVGALGDAGARGVSVSASGGELRLEVDRDALTGALTEQLGEKAALGAVLGGLVDGLTGRMAALAGPSVGPLRTPVLRPGDEIKARLVATQTPAQTATSLLERYLETSKRRREGAGTNISLTG